MHREKLAVFLATQATGQQYPLVDFTVLIHSGCVGAISALLKGAPRSPALQNVALLHNHLFMVLGAMPPLCLHAHCVVFQAEGVYGQFRASQDFHVCIVCIEISSLYWSPNTNIIHVCLYSDAIFRIGLYSCIGMYCTCIYWY